MDSSNTVVKAATLMREVYHLDQKFHIHVEKNIPAQAGLAGGSSDGAAVMRGIRELCKLDVPIEELAMLSKRSVPMYHFVLWQKVQLCKELVNILHRLMFIVI